MAIQPSVTIELFGIDFDNLFIFTINSRLLKLYNLAKSITILFFKHKWLVIFFLQVVLINICNSQPIVRFTSVISGLSSPVDIVNAGDATNRIFIAQQGGIIKVYNSSYVFLGNFLTVSGISTGAERGLLSIAFHPDYETNGFFWVYYTNTSGDIELARYQVSLNPDQADPASKQVVMTIPHPVNTNHNGGKLNFGSDGYLYFGTGDGGGSGDIPNNAQNGNVLLGKMLRINVTTTPGPPYYTIPPDNPYLLDASILDEIFDLGLRNPFRWSFDRNTNDMWIGDVGQSAREEINYRPSGTTAGINYGWRCYEGNLPYNTSGCLPIANYVFPIYDYPNPPTSSASVIGGYVYRGATYPLMQGYYIATDVYSGKIYITNTNFGFTTTIQPGIITLVVGFGESETGELFAVSLNGNAYSLRSISILSAGLISFNGVEKNGICWLNWETAFEQDLKQFEIEFSNDAITFSTAGIIQAKNDINGARYSFEHQPNLNADKVYYRLKTVDKDNKFSYSAILTIKFYRDGRLFVYPSPVKGNNITMNIKEPYSVVQIINSNGYLVHKEHLNSQTGQVRVHAINIVPGVYLVQLSSNTGSISQKVIFLR